MDNPRAKKLGTSEDKMCDLCYLLSSTNKGTKFHLYDQGTYSFPGDKYVCENCLEWVREMRHKSYEQCKHPEKDIFKDVNFWWFPKTATQGPVSAEVKDKS